MCSCKNKKGLHASLTTPINFAEWEQIDGVLVSPEDPRLKPSALPLAAAPVAQYQILNDADLAQIKETNLRSTQFMEEINANGGKQVFKKAADKTAISSNIKTFGLAGLAFALVVFVGRKIKGNTKFKKPREVIL